VVRKKIKKNYFRKIKFLVLDFDGVITDNKVYMDQDGKEMVCCSRADGLGIERIKEAGIKVAVISKEINKVVNARCEKMKIKAFRGVNNKAGVFEMVLQKFRAEPQQTCYLGNDINDIECIKLAGVGCAVKDAHKLVRKAANYVTKKSGGNGAIREICDLILGSS